MNKPIGDIDFYESSLDDSIELPAHLTYILFDNANADDHPLLTTLIADHSRHFTFDANESFKLLGEILSLLEHAGADKYALSIMMHICRKLHEITAKRSTLTVFFD